MIFPAYYTLEKSYVLIILQKYKPGLGLIFKLICLVMTFIRVRKNASFVVILILLPLYVAIIHDVILLKPVQTEVKLHN